MLEAVLKIWTPPKYSLLYIEWFDKIHILLCIVLVHLNLHTFIFLLAISGMVEMEFPQATINTSYSGTCNATANPRPEVFASISAENCPYTISYANISSYTREVTVTIPHITEQCRDAVISCHACHVTKKAILNVTESESLIIHTYMYAPIDPLQVN